MIQRQRRPDPLAIHHHEAGAVYKAQRPLVPFQKSVQSLSMQVGFDPAEGHQRDQAPLKVTNGVQSKTVLQDGMGFNEDVVGCDQAGPLAQQVLEGFGRLFVTFLVLDQQRVERRSVDEDAQR